MEVGLDFTPRYLTNGSGDKDEQRAVLGSQIELAKELGLTLNVHSRSAGKPVIEQLQSYGAKNVLLHAFTGNIKSVRLGVEADFHFSLAPAFTVNKEKGEDAQAYDSVLCLALGGVDLTIYKTCSIYFRIELFT
uniref:Deoxyribonuclease TATDN1 n=1 Tax=Meloidogyne javanica TaxID=6303 RepID=A0A915N3V6_MELJA